MNKPHYNSRRIRQGISFAGFLFGSVLATAPPNQPLAADIAQHRVNFLTTLLSLTTAQQQQATTTFTNAATAASSVISAIPYGRR